MASLIEVRRLLRFSDHRQQRCELALSSARRRLSPLELELGAIDRQAEGFRELMLSNRMEAQTVSHSQLFAQLRRQAVIRRQIANLGLERARVLFYRQLPLLDFILKGGLPATIKAGLRSTGLDVGNPRLPVSPLSDAASKQLRAMIDA